MIVAYRLNHTCPTCGTPLTGVMTAQARVNLRSLRFTDTRHLVFIRPCRCGHTAPVDGTPLKWAITDDSQAKIDTARQRLRERRKAKAS